MFTFNRILVFFGILIACCTCVSAFFLNWGSPEATDIKQPSQQWPVATFYQQRIYQPHQPAFAVSPEPQGPVQIPAIPIQLPLQAQLSPAANIHNVQLVPCLCPVSPDAEYEKYQESSAFVNQIQKQPN